MCSWTHINQGWGEYKKHTTEPLPHFRCSKLRAHSMTIVFISERRYFLFLQYIQPPRRLAFKFPVYFLNLFLNFNYMYMWEENMGRCECRYLGSPERGNRFWSSSNKQLRAVWHGYWEPNSTPLQEQHKLLTHERFSSHSRLFSTQKFGLLCGNNVISSPCEAKVKTSRWLLVLIWSCDLFTPTPYSDLHVDLHSSAQCFLVLPLHHISCHSQGTTHSDFAQLWLSCPLCLSMFPGQMPSDFPSLGSHITFRWGLYWLFYFILSINLKP